MPHLIEFSCVLCGRRTYGFNDADHTGTLAFCSKECRDAGKAAEVLRTMGERYPIVRCNGRVLRMGVDIAEMSVRVHQPARAVFVSGEEDFMQHAIREQEVTIKFTPHFHDMIDPGDELEIESSPGERYVVNTREIAIVDDHASRGRSVTIHGSWMQR